MLAPLPSVRAQFGTTGMYHSCHKGVWAVLPQSVVLICRHKPWDSRENQSELRKILIMYNLLIFKFKGTVLF